MRRRETDAPAVSTAAFIEAPRPPLLQTKKFKAIYSVHDAFLKGVQRPAVVNGGYIAKIGFIKTGRSSKFVHDLVSTKNAWSSTEGSEGGQRRRVAGERHRRRQIASS